VSNKRPQSWQAKKVELSLVKRFWWALAMSGPADPNVEVTQTYPVGYSCSQMPRTPVLRRISQGHCSTAPWAAHCLHPAS